MREKEESCSVIFLRHGVTDYPEDRIYKGEDDPCLNESGHGQAKELARWLSGQNISKIYVSPTARTRQTADPIIQELGLGPIVKSDLRERDFGVWEGLTFDEIKTQFGEGFSAWKKDPISYKPKEGESILDLKRRLQVELDGIISQHLKQTVLVVSHVGPIRVALTLALGVPVEHYRRMNIYYGSASRVDYGKKQPNLIYLNYLPGGRLP